MSFVLELRVTDGTRALADVDVTLFIREAGSVDTKLIDLKAVAGTLSFPLGPGAELLAVLVKPPGDHWPVVLGAPYASTVVAVCRPLPTDGPIGWWHKLVGQTSYNQFAGSGIRVGVVDTGLARHVALQHAHSIDVARSTLDESFVDLSGHGTHVTGLIVGRPVERGRYSGIAPGATLLMAGVFNRDELASTRDVADAIEALSQDHKVDLINLSLGGAVRSQVVLDAIRDAYAEGCLCIAAAGNDGRDVDYPARFEEVVAISALGILNWAPLGSLAATFVPDDPAEFGPGGLYLATFSARGPEIGSTAPGVGLISCTPNGTRISSLYAAMSGTSMAAPVATGVLAQRLSLDGQYLSMPRNAGKADRASAILNRSLQDLGLARELQGGGLLTWDERV